MRRLALILSILASPAMATQEYILPTLFDVTGVAGDDVLNIREDPAADAAVIGTLPPDGKGIEVVTESRGWGRVNAGERSGWVNMRYLAYRTDVWQADRLPASFACYGTEPFWSLTRKGDQIVMSRPDAADQSVPIEAVMGTGLYRDPMRAVVAGDLTLVTTPQLCSDGMSDRLFGLRASLVQTGQQPALWSGCCTIGTR